MLQNEKFILVDNEEALSGLLQDLDQHEMAAVDTEADSMHHYLARLCLIQITIGDHHYIVDPLCGLDISPLFKAKAMQTLIFHGADYDLRLLWQAYGFSPAKIFDTMLAAKMLGEPHLGLADLVREYFGEELKKENQRADWSLRPLPLDMCEYAIHDTFYLHELCAILVEKLQKAGRLAWLTEQCDALIEHSRQPSLIKKDPWRIPGSSLFDPCTLNLLKHIWEWREKEAEALDRPPYKVMPAELMLAIVRSLRTQFPEVDKDRMPKLPRNFKGERLDSFIQMFKTAVTVPESEWPEKLPKAPPPPVVPHSDLLIALKIWRDEEAEKLKLDPSLIANKGQLIWLAAPGSMPWETRYEEAHLMRWQKNIWNNILQEHLPTAKRIGED
ncbi:MAG: ribonuclease D [Fibrobacter sp.]|jgi:ribonuclease D|uniref:ribonuclease D n=1 Tax=uncultured Fibrobacter sp. TaxID=261512 RepID=UPI001567052C|nr:ribonuclease D [uncultured Fibrobacter sp.]MBQ1823660.1 ribonuclease D [Fibrobacter sp.]MBR6318635.1 ribonuclease D [Fibrobacter sp.]